MEKHLAFLRRLDRKKFLNWTHLVLYDGVAGELEIIGTTANYLLLLYQTFTELQERIRDAICYHLEHWSIDDVMNNEQIKRERIKVLSELFILAARTKATEAYNQILFLLTGPPTDQTISAMHSYLPLRGIFASKNARFRREDLLLLGLRVLASLKPVTEALAQLARHLLDDARNTFEGLKKNDKSRVATDAHQFIYYVPLSFRLLWEYWLLTISSQPRAIVGEPPVEIVTNFCFLIRLCRLNFFILRSELNSYLLKSETLFEAILPKAAMQFSLNSDISAGKATNIRLSMAGEDWEDSAFLNDTLMKMGYMKYAPIFAEDIIATIAPLYQNETSTDTWSEIVEANLIVGRIWNFMGEYADKSRLGADAEIEMERIISYWTSFLSKFDKSNFKKTWYLLTSGNRKAVIKALTPLERRLVGRQSEENGNLSHKLAVKVNKILEQYRLIVQERGQFLFEREPGGAVFGRRSDLST